MCVCVHVAGVGEGVVIAASRAEVGEHGGKGEECGRGSGSC